MNDLLIEFNKDISRVFEYIEKGEEIQARFIFNSEVYGKYKEEFVSGGVLNFATELWVVLDEYLNNDSVRELRKESSNKQFLLSVYEDYQEDFKKIS